MSLVNEVMEADVLGGMMLASAWGEPVAQELAGVLGDDAFSLPLHRTVYATVARLARSGQAHDMIAVAAELRDGEDGIGLADVGSLTQGVASVVNIEHHARRLRDLADRRALASSLREAQEALSHNSVSDTIAALTKRIDAILASGAPDADTFASVIERAEQFAIDAEQARKSGKPAGIPYGIPALDRATGGMRPGELIGIAARTSVGKTAVSMQMALHAASRGHRGLILSLEESPEGLGLRAIANRGGLNLMAMRSGSVSHDTVSDAVRDRDLYELPLWVDTRTHDLPRIAGRITRYAKRERIAFAVVDHIGLVRLPNTSGKRRYEELGEVTRTLKLLAVQLGISILCMVQVGRDSEKQNRRPMLSDLRESGNVEQDLNVCIALNPTGEADARGVVPVELGLLKNRYGPRGWLPRAFEFDGATQMFREIL